ncbi:glycosyltransferase family 2 protein [Campylobacter sp. VBCF_05 NA6]|uniref:glycosyltransferase family 2 protein n=1 Tax=unclassified Campylobacter TaxID=2593542 RepID=UPI0022E9BBAE|nr:MULTISPECIES: glycosyltransferase family 2 protein [unclassified Campylobacter]MDA3056886.1 glycosyltransferase family 2 protein [Campylobacter sp. VBCF_04 NA7]MDA3058654.1 glycosyltransferase family 2 protein [Campylobacter sp. VBCF_05 NA6]
MKNQRERESKSENLNEFSQNLEQNFTQNNPQKTTQNSTKLLSIVVPCYNEELVLDEFYKVTLSVLKQIKAEILPNLEYEFIFVDDGSRDNTAEKVKELHEKDNAVHLVKFSRNFGKEAAILAGFKHANGDMIVLMDADLEHPPTLINDMIKGYLDGYKIIYAKRKSRPGTSFIKAKFSEAFYKIFNRISGVKIESGVTDYRLMDKSVVAELLKMNEYHRFSKSMFAWVGFKKKCLEFDHEPRIAGETSWSFWKLFNYAVEGFVSFSTAPLRVAFVLGFLASFLAFIYGSYVILKTLIFGVSISGWATTIVLILFIGGIQLIVLGVIGEYIARIYEQVKNRPHFIIEEII